MTTVFLVDRILTEEEAIRVAGLADVRAKLGENRFGPPGCFHVLWCKDTRRPTCVHTRGLATVVCWNETEAITYWISDPTMFNLSTSSHPQPYGFVQIPENAIAGIRDYDRDMWTGDFFFTVEEAYQAAYDLPTPFFVCKIAENGEPGEDIDVEW